jgi:hypothetical protein
MEATELPTCRDGSETGIFLEIKPFYNFGVCPERHGPEAHDPSLRAEN